MWDLRDDSLVRPDAALLSKINSLGSAAADHQQPLPADDMVIGRAFLAREAITMERTRLRTGALGSSRALKCTSTLRAKNVSFDTGVVGVPAFGFVIGPSERKANDYVCCKVE